MTGRQLFDAAYLRVCRALNAEPLDEQADECYRAVSSYPASLFDAAASRLNETARFLPKPSEWRETLRDLSLEQEQQARRDREQVAADLTTYHCHLCQDTGWEPMHCTDKDWCGLCRKHRAHLYDHDVVTECRCRPTNPAWQAKVDKQRAMVQSKQERGRAA